MNADFRDFVPQQRFQPTLAVSPDGGWVAYSCNASGQHNAWIAPIGGGPARQVTFFTDHAVRQVAWSPDGRTLAFAADEHGDEQYQVYVVNVGGGDPRRVTDAIDSQHVLGDKPFSPDSATLVYAANDRDPMVQDLLLHDLRTGTVRRIESDPGRLLFGASFSPDGRRLLAASVRSNTDSDCMVVDLDDSTLTPITMTAHDGDAVNVPGPWAADSSGFHVLTNAGREFTGWSFLTLETGVVEPVEHPGWDVEQITATDDGATFAWTVNEAGRSVPHVRRDGNEVTIDGLSVGEIAPVSLTPDGTTLVFLVNSELRPTDVAALDLDSAELRYLTDSRPPALSAVEPRSAELVTYSTHDGRDIPAWLYRPAGDGPFAVLVSIHGGPEAQERPTYSYSGLYQYLLANGIGVLAPNVRGSTGYGSSYQKLIHRDWGGAELGDFEHAVSYLRTLDWVDAGRIAVFGGSFGGFATLSCVSRLPDLWAAGVSIVGPSNLVTFTRAVPPTWRPLMAEWVGDPDADAEFLTERSPITYADRITAPLFVIQGANDPRVVKAESDQIVESLRQRGVVVRYDVYDDEGHGFTKRDNEIQAITDVGAFLVQHLTPTGA